ncbi:beta-N-acetylglucosaminidase domain-containing protein [Erythrobacter sp. AP23]|uniref:beta-N-acetylglucosaminidase domain-containing protein n=1 Tax=Erythrobacter sp. AP23 TaxID=499656 RepID=UPI0021016DF1|nr:beta-N-acetylglucosaminidase domain-containing protein [Erythrobacter sp. AP23]
MTQSWRTPLWLIEAFYGTPWPMEARLANYRLIGRWGYEGAIYAPKSDRSLRSEWQRDFTREENSQLEEMAATARESGLEFGVGLSPLEIWEDWSRENRARLRSKLISLHDRGCRVLSLLFDDMRGDRPQLASFQGEIVAFVRDHWPGHRVIVCPTYYSDDPILASIFGEPPPRYLEELSHRIAPDVGIFWTGPKVVSDAIGLDHIREVTSRMGRQPFLWDNYPVNDGARTSRYLFLKGVQGRGPLMSGQLVGYAANPMVQPHLSQIPLHALGRLARDPVNSCADAAFEDSVRACVSGRAAGAILAHVDDFCERGLDLLSDREQELIAGAFREIGGPHASEVVAWLANEYEFDPDCLTG